MALGCYPHRGSNTESGDENSLSPPIVTRGLAAASVTANSWLREKRTGRAAYRRSLDRDTLEVAVLLVVFQCAPRYFSTFRYRAVV